MRRANQSKTSHRQKVDNIAEDRRDENDAEDDEDADGEMQRTRTTRPAGAAEINDAAEAGVVATAEAGGGQDAHRSFATRRAQKVGEFGGPQQW